MGPIRTANHIMRRRFSMRRSIFFGPVGCRMQKRFFHRIVEIQPRHFDTLHLLGVVLSQQGNHAEGLRFLDVALQIKTGSIDVHNSRGNLLTALGRLR